MNGGGVRIDFWNDKGDCGIHAEGRGIVDYDATRFGGNGAKLFRNTASCGKKGNVDSLERISGKFLDGDFLASKGEFLASGTCGSEKGEFGEREVSLGEADEHFPAYRSGSSDDGNMRLVVHRERDVTGLFVRCNPSFTRDEGA